MPQAKYVSEASDTHTMAVALLTRQLRNFRASRCAGVPSNATPLQVVMLMLRGPDFVCLGMFNRVKAHPGVDI
jgi:hypothetical protein